MTSLGGLNPTSTALTLGLVQQQVPLISTIADVDATTDLVCRTVREAKSGFGSLDMLVFPEYSLHGLRKSSWALDDVMCDMDGPQVDRLREVCRESTMWGCFSVMERNPNGAPFNSGIIVDADGEIVLYVRKLHPWTPKEPWEPGDLGVPVCEGPKGAVLSLLICHDGMFPEMAREACYRGANVLLRTAGYKFPLAQAWRITNEANAFQNLAFTASVCLAGDDGNGIPSMGEAMVCDYEGTIVEQGDSTPGRIVTTSIEPTRADVARREWGWRTTSTNSGTAVIQPLLVAPVTARIPT